jgi:subtilisin family serine protease
VGGTTSSILEAVNLDRLMAVEIGASDVMVAILDGPVAGSHPALSEARIHAVGSWNPPVCRDDNAACRHGTFVAGILVANRSFGAPAICPGCTLLVRPIFSDRPGAGLPEATTDELARAIDEAVGAGASVINVSSALSPSMRAEPELHAALAIAGRRGVVVVAAAGNESAVGSSPLTRHPAVVPVVACDDFGRPTPSSNLAHSLGSRGIAAPGTVTSISPRDGEVTLSGTSFAAAVVSGACALLRSALPRAGRQEVVQALAGSRRSAISPPRLDAWGAYQQLVRAGIAA